jgi:hypothetical protein
MKHGLLLGLVGWCVLAASCNSGGVSAGATEETPTPEESPTGTETPSATPTPSNTHEIRFVALGDTGTGSWST